MADFVYVVYGSTGEYSDHTEWTIAVYTTEEQAKDHAARATKWVKENIDYYDSDYDKSKTNPYDPSCRVGYTGTEYDVLKVPYVRHVDEYLEHIQEPPRA